MTLLRHLVAAVVAGAVLWAASVQLSAFRDFQMAEVAVYVVAIAGLSRPPITAAVKPSTKIESMLEG